MSGPRVEIGVLGTSTLVVDGAPAPLNALRMRSLLAALVLGPGPSVSSDRLVDALWEQRPSAGATSTLQGYVSRMRRLLEPSCATAGGSRSIQHATGAYLLDLGPEGTVDAHRFDASVTAAQDFLRDLHDPARPGVSDRPDRVEVQRERLDRALATWRGEPYADLGDDDIAVAERRRLTERRVDGRTALQVMELMMGRATEAAVGLEELVDAHPLREQLWRLWAVALVRSGRQAHALDALARLRVLLSSELGIDPSPAVTSLQDDILRQDPSALGSSTRPQPPQHPAPHQPFPLLGRDRELRLLQDAVRGTVAGHGRHAVVVADPGMGKSRLVAEVLDWTRRHQHVNTVTLRGAGHAAAPPMWSLMRAVAALSEQTGVVAPESLCGPTEDSFERAAAFADYVCALAVRGPIVLVAEDLHRIDGATIGALAHLVGEAIDLPVMLLVSRRPGVHDDESDDLAVGIARAGGLWLELSGLDATDTRRLADALPTARHLTEADAERFRARAGGNPLHLTALLEQATDDVPSAVVALVHAELRCLPPDAAEVLGTAARFGPRFPVDVVLPQLPGQTGLIEIALEAARRSGLVRRAPEGWEFSSPVVHEAVLAVLARGERLVAAPRDGVDPHSPRRGRLTLVSDTREA